METHQQMVADKLAVSQFMTTSLLALPPVVPVHQVHAAFLFFPQRILLLVARDLLTRPRGSTPDNLGQCGNEPSTIVRLARCQMLS